MSWRALFAGWYPKCDAGTMTHGSKTDVRAYWPACPLFERKAS